MVGATPLSTETASCFLRRFDVRLNNSYGLTETCLITSNLYPKSEEELTSIGPAIAGIEARIDDIGLGIEGAGELVVRSDGFADRYFSSAVEPLWQDGWFHTGDIVRNVNNGHFKILARVAELISAGDRYILPFEVESLLQRHPQVKEAAVVGVEVKPGKVESAAFVVRSGAVSTGELHQLCTENLDAHKVPRHIEFLEEFPKSITGKISKAKLQLTRPSV